MSASKIGQQYDRIAAWWAEYHQASDYGVEAVKRAIKFTKPGGHALDVGCGAGGRLVNILEGHDFALTGIDASREMIALARKAHPKGDFTVADIQNWQSDDAFDFILAWDCLFHLPLNQQAPVLKKLCGILADNGVLMYSFGDDVGSHSDEWQGQIFDYSSIGVTRNVEILQENGLVLRHLELDQFPEKHTYVIAQKPKACG